MGCWWAEHTQEKSEIISNTIYEVRHKFKEDFNLMFTTQNHSVIQTLGVGVVLKERKIDISHC